MQVYQPVMTALFDMPGMMSYPIGNLPTSREKPQIAWREAYTIGQQLMAEQARLQNFKPLADETLMYMSDKGLYAYTIKSNQDISDKNGATAVYFDGDSGAFVALYLPAGQNAGSTITRWLVALHTASIWGLPYQIFICLLGLIVAMLSITGVYLWWKKRQAKQKSVRRRPIATMD
jgi:uncharacterized iron-regulated membrane protein